MIKKSIYDNVYLHISSFFSPQNLDAGARKVKIYFDGELLFNGEVDKGCGNQVFDYGKHIVFSSLKVNSTKTSTANSSQKPSSSSSSSKKDLSLNINAASSSSFNQTTKNSEGQGQGHSASSSTSPSKSVTAGSHHTFRSISRSSQSSASSSGSLPSSSHMRATSEERGDGKRSNSKERSETRTLMRPTILKRRGSGSSSSPDIEATSAGKFDIFINILLLFPDLFYFLHLLFLFFLLVHIIIL